MKLGNKQASLGWPMWGSMHSDIKKTNRRLENKLEESNSDILSYFSFILNPTSIMSINRFSLALQILSILSQY